MRKNSHHIKLCSLFPEGRVKMNCFRLNYFYNTNWTTAYTSSLPLDNKYLVATWWLYCLFPSLRNTLARPKSAIFRCPVELISKLAGFKSFRKERIAKKYFFFLKLQSYHEMAFMSCSVYCLEFGERGYIYLAPT